MQPKFRKLLRENKLPEINSEMSVATQFKIRKFQKIEKELPADTGSVEYITMIEQLAELDQQIINALNEDFEVVNEKSENLKKRALLVGLRADASEHEILAAEKQKSDQAAAVAAQRQKEEQERADAAAAAKKQQEDEQAATAAEQKKKQEEAAAFAKLHKDVQALITLHKAGKTQVTEKELHQAGFNIGFFGPISDNGCTVGGYKLYRANQYERTFTLTKV